MAVPHSVLSSLVIACMAHVAAAQTSVNEIEPNGSKTQATPASGLLPGDTLNGTTTGTDLSIGAGGLATADTWLVQTAPLVLGIYRHALTVTTTGGGQYSPTIRGVNQVGGVIGTTDSVLQTAFVSTTPPYTNVWYGFGKQEQIYWRITGSTLTTSPYVATLQTTTVTPLVVPGVFNPGQVIVTTYQQGHATDTEIYLYDANLDPVPLGHNDGTLTSGISNSILTMQNLPAGTYYVAISAYNTANNQSDANPDDPYQSDPLLDFPNVMTTSNTFVPQPVTFTVTDGVNSTQQPAMLQAPFEIVWAQIQVGNPSSPTTIFCSGDGSGTACPCGNAGTSGNGCASSVSAAGAHVAGAGVASISADTLVLSGSGMPNSSALYFQGTTQLAGGNGTVFGDGLRCAGGSIVRLGTKTNSAGASTYPGPGNTAISVKGADSAGAVRTYQIWYRNAAAFCTASTFNLTNGLELTWGP